MRKTLVRAQDARYLTTKEVGELLGLTVETVRDKVARGEIVARRAPSAAGNGRLLFRPSDVQRYVDGMPKAAS